MKLLLVATLFVVANANNIPFDLKLDEHWENFKTAFGKSYSGQEEAARRIIWEENVAKIVHHNLRADVGLHTYKRGLNEYADMSHEEFVQTFTGYRRPSNFRSNVSLWIDHSNVQTPGQVDWRDQGLVTPVKNQKKCDAGWAFSATGALEGQHKKKTGQLVSLSEQNLIDCSTSEGNHGCEDGFMHIAFEYVRKNNGIDTEASYPYEAKDGSCRFKTSDVGATCTEWRGVAAIERELEYYVATVGPISATIDASLQSFQTYSSGIYNEIDCNRYGVLNHGVLVVGYGSEDGNYYWLVKNSWGTTWGMNGYIKMSKDRYNQCGIASLASYPIV